MKQLQRAKPFTIDRWDLYHAYERVKSNRGNAGIDGIELSDYEKGLKGNLYKLWNRMSSGSYMPKAVKLVEIPKSNGGSRPLGIPKLLSYYFYYSLLSECIYWHKYTHRFVFLF